MTDVRMVVAGDANYWHRGSLILAPDGTADAPDIVDLDDLNKDDRGRRPRRHSPLFLI